MISETVDIPSNVKTVLGRIGAACRRAGRRPAGVTLVAVSKGMGVSSIQVAYEAGVRHFGENRVQEAEGKITGLAGLTDITWHLVGHLQSNKLKAAMRLFHIIHSVDSTRLAEALSRQATAMAGREAFPVLLEVNVARESTKQGFDVEDVPGAVEAASRLRGVRIVGLMAIAPAVGDPEEVRPVFRKLRELRDALGLAELSMGMTEDFEAAIEEGATMVRIGRAIFGPRNS